MKNCRQIILLVTFFSLLSVGWSQCDDGYVEDCSGDGAVNILDMVQLANMILSDEYQGSGDLNDDGMLNILDIVQLVNIILRRTG